MASGVPPATASPAFPDILHDLLEVSLTAINLLRPVYGPDGTAIVDFTLDYLNPAAQRMAALPERPGGTLLSHRPSAAVNGILDYYRRVFETGATEVFEVDSQAERLDNFFRLAARRSGEWLVVSFTDTGDQPRTPVEIALREAQAAEKAARADAEAQRNELRDFLEHAPVAVAFYRGPEFRVELANATTLAIWDRPLKDVLGRPVFDVLPEAGTPDIRAIFERVFTTGVPHTAIEQPTFIRRHGRQQTVYWNFVFQPEYQPDGSIGGIRSVGTEVTAQVRARQQVEQFNQELDTRVQERTQEALVMQSDLLAAARQQTRLYEVFAHTPAPIALLRGPGHRFEYVNAAYQVLFPSGPLVGREVADAAPELVAQGFGTLLDRVYHTGETYFGQELPFTPQPAPGQAPRTAYFNFTYQAYRENEQIAGISIFAFDVTEQVLARREREFQRQLLSDVFAQAPAGIWVVRGPEYVFEVINPTMTRVIRRTAEQCLGRPYFEVLPELTSQGVPELLRRVWEQGESMFVEEFAAQLDPQAPDEVGYFTFAFQPLRDEHGQVARISCVALDVTFQVRARQQIEESEARFRTMADAAPNQVWAVNPDSTIRYVNRAFLAFVGLDTEEEYTATGWGPYLHPDEATRTQQFLSEAIAQRRPYVLEHRMRHHDGQYRWLLSQGAPSYLADGELYGYVGSAIDITDLKHANQQLTRTNQDLDNFVYAASHDLKQPVNNLAGLLKELQRSVVFTDPSEEQVLVPLVREALQQLSTTIDDLATLGQAQQTGLVPTEQVSLDELTEEVINSLEPQVRAARARITTDFTCWPALSFARANLRTILLNLLGNSLKYADPARPARIHVSMWVEQGHPVLVVEDNGLGFDADKHGTELFQLFQRLHTHTPGTGVGLYLVHRIVEATGGTIAVDSQPGEGATFRIRFGLN